MVTGVSLLLWLAGLVLGHPVAIPAGVVRVGVDGALAEADEGPPRTVRVAAFSIDRTEVTRSAYAWCVLARLCPTRPLTLSDLSSRLPMTDVSHDEARLYCAARSARLPTEVEFALAARGSTDVRRYPWGDELDCARGNFGNFEGEGRCALNPGRPVEVGSYARGASPAGVLDLAGNVWEWAADFYDPRGPAHTAPVARGVEELGRASRHAVRGGACCSMFGLPRIDDRLGFPADYRDGDLGFRCVR